MPGLKKFKTVARFAYRRLTSDLSKTLNKKELKDTKGIIKLTIRRQTDNALAKNEEQRKRNSNKQNLTQKTKDQATCTNPTSKQCY